MVANCFEDFHCGKVALGIMQGCCLDGLRGRVGCKCVYFKHVTAFWIQAKTHTAQESIVGSYEIKSIPLHRGVLLMECA